MQRVWRQIRFIHWFGIRLFALNLFLKIFDKRIASSDKVYAILLKKHEIVMKHLQCYIDQYREPPLEKKEKAEEFVIWTMWWQGETEAPESIRLCLNSIRKNSNGYRLIVITKDNYLEYIQIPRYIVTKFEQGKISRTHLSDIIRMNLLYTYGGLWIDGGILVTKKIEQFTGNYYTLRMPRERYSCISEKRWVAGVCGGIKHYEFFYYMKEMFHLYWKSENGLIDYCLTDYFMDAFLLNNERFQMDMDKIPIKRYRLFDMLGYMNQEMNESILKDLEETTGYFRISWRNEMKKTIDGKLTFYGYFCEKYGVGRNEGS